MAIKKQQQELRTLLIEENEIIIKSLSEIIRLQAFIVIPHKDSSQTINLMKWCAEPAHRV